MYAIRLSNGKELTGLHLNGSAFETEEDMKFEDIVGGLRHVVIEQTEAEEWKPEDVAGEYDNMMVGYIGRHGGVTQLVLNAADEEEQERLKVRADIDYIAIMTGVEL